MSQWSEADGLSTGRGESIKKAVVGCPLGMTPSAIHLRFGVKQMRGHMEQNSGSRGQSSLLWKRAAGLQSHFPALWASGSVHRSYFTPC